MRKLQWRSYNIENLRTMYKEKTCKCKYSQPATKCSENGITSYCTKCEKDTKITTMKVLDI
jgi:hypothetical protein